jgi:hypothetical protein
MQNKPQANIARRHHVIPQLYLAGFTNSGEKDGLLYAHDLSQLKTWKAKPANVAFVKDFYKIDAPGIDADAIEKSFWEIEGQAARVLKKIIELNRLPARRKGYGILMQFMAQLVMRRPSVRENLTQTTEKLLRMVDQMHASFPDDQLRAKFDRLREQNPDMPEVDLDAFREFVKSDEYTIEFPQNFHINNLMTTLLPVADETIAPLLALRHWVLWVAQDGAGHFITSDRPVVLTWTIEVPPFYEDSPGFGLENTLVVFPISKKLVIYGRFDGPRNAVIPAGAEQVALINRMMSRSVVRFIYSTDEDFVWKKLDESIGNRRDMFDAIKEHQAKKAAAKPPTVKDHEYDQAS